MKTIDAIKGNEERVLKHYGLRLTGNKHIDCGICADKKSLRINIYNDQISYICKCGNGSIFKYLEESTGQDFKRLARDIDQLLGNTHEREEPIEVKEDVGAKAVSKLRSLPGLRGTDGQEYLNQRGIFTLPKNGIRYNSKEGNYQSLYSIATDDSYRPAYLHRTLLDGSKKANVEASKKLLTLNECFGSVSIKMFSHQTALGIAEGIETALSATQIYKVATWSVLNTSLMKRFKAPPGVEHLMIFADNDKKGAGHAAAFECAHKNLVANNDVTRVTVRWPSEFGDFNDVLTSGYEVYEWGFKK